MKPIYVAQFGLGNIGNGVARELLKGELPDVYLKTIIVKNLDKPRDIEIHTGVILTDDPRKAFNDKDINIYLELVGGEEEAERYITEGLARASLVTANKDLVAKHMQGLFALASEFKHDIGYEASVGGGIQLYSLYNRLSPVDDIFEIKGIVNGTTNYIVTRMDYGLDFDNGLKEAQAKGYAEADPRKDIDGIDSKYKLAIIAQRIWKIKIDPAQIFCESLKETGKIPFDEVVRAKKLGFRLKYLAVARKNNEAIELGVYPAWLDIKHPLAEIDDVENAIYWNGRLCGPQLCRGKGAGQNPTTSAVLSDIHHIASNIRRGATDDYPPIYSKPNSIGKESAKSGRYLKIPMKDQPGALNYVTKVLADHKINLDRVLQLAEDKYEKSGVNCADAVITTDPVESKLIERVLEEIKRLECVVGEPFSMRAEK